MGIKLTKFRLLLLLILLGGCAYFYSMERKEPSKHSTMRLKKLLRQSALSTRSTFNTTKRQIIKQNIDFVEMAHDLRAYFLNQSENLREKLFPWWLNRPTDNSFSKDDTSKGIVICTGDKHFRLTLVGLKALQLIGNELPIEVVYSTSADLSLENRRELENSFPNIQLVDLSTTSIDDNYLELRGWEIKPYAVLASQFRHVLLMDADVLFLEKPSTLFENQYYLKTGTLFFYDRVFLSSETTQWIRTLLTNNKDQPIPHRTQESGVVLIDKARVLPGLLSTCKLNDHQEREQVTYKRLYGDKDTWWLGFHLIEMPYSFIPTFTGSIGQVSDTGQSSIACGHILHLDENYRPIWWNGGLFKNRYYSLTDLLTIDGWLYEGHWTLKVHSCLTNSEQKGKKFTKEQQQLIEDYRRTTKTVFNIN